MASNRFTFTKKAIERLCRLHAGQRFVAHDTQSPGLIAEIRPGGTCSFFLYRRIDGRPTRMRIGTFPSVTVENARNQVSQWNGDIAKGKNPAADRKAVRDTMTLAELWEHYLAVYSKPRKKSWKTDEWLYNKFLKPWASRRINQISKTEFARFHAKLGETSITNANRARSLLLTMYTKAADDGYGGVNPVNGVDPFPEKKRERYMTADELKRWFDALVLEQNQVLADAMRFAIWTGARRGNWLSARWDEMDFNSNAWTVPPEKSKNGKPIVIPLCTQALEILERRKQSGDSNEWVFPSRFGEGPSTTAKYAWARACKAAGLKDCRIHDLRRTNATFAVSAGVSIYQVSKMLGHGSTSVTESTYAHMHDVARREASNITAKAIEAAIAPKAEKPARKKSGGKGKTRKGKSNEQGE